MLCYMMLKSKATRTAVWKEEQQWNMILKTVLEVFFLEDILKKYHIMVLDGLF